MKYNITINQLTWMAFFPHADFRHAILFEAIKTVCHSQNGKILRTSDGFTWIASNKILSDIPMLKIKSKAGLTPLIKDLEKWGLLDIQCEKGGKQYYKPTELSERLETSMDSENIKQVLDSLNGTVRKSKRHRLQKRTYKYIIDPNIIDPKDVVTKKPVATTPEKSKTSKRKKTFPHDSREYRAARFCTERILESHPDLKFTESDMQAAAKQFDLLFRVDGESPRDVYHVLKWLPTAPTEGNFSWKDVLMSPRQIRKKRDGVTFFRKLKKAMDKDTANKQKQQGKYPDPPYWHAEEENEKEPEYEYA